MKTSAPAPQADMLPAHQLEHTGVLLEPACAKVRQLDTEGHVVPVLCMELELEGPLRNHAHIEQPFPPGHQSQCEAAARRLKRGARVTFQAPVVGLRLIAPNVTHIHVHGAKEPS